MDNAPATPLPVYNLTVPHINNAAAIFCERRVVGDEENRLSHALGKAMKKLYDRQSISAVEVAGRLVR